LFETAMWSIGQYRSGIEQALDVRRTSLFLPVPGLDSRLDGLTILHLSDLHLDSLAGIRAAIASAANGLKPDLCLLTGDYAAHYRRNAVAVVQGMQEILAGVQARHGIYLSLGNYDSARLATDIRAEPGWRLLVNESVTLDHNGANVSLLGLDDPFEQAHEPMVAALAAKTDGFRIVLSHTPDLAAAAAAAGHDLYLCGHTHGGQICLPNGRPLIVNTSRPDLACGLWREGGMWGYTTRGAGVSGIPRRHNCPPEVAMLTLLAGYPTAA
jgi:predicted MPP superfamily phosphohydrolase